MIDIALNINKLKAQIPSSVKIVAVSKTRPVSDIMIAYNSGQRAFGENRVQELLSKKDLLPSDIEWHLIGHLQTNKVKSVISFISMIQSVDSSRLLSVINSDALKAGRITDCLLQFHIAKEESKFGFDFKEACELIESQEYGLFKNIRICGVMGMATFTDNMDLVREEFKFLKSCFNLLKEKYFFAQESFNEISMGMSGDFLVAVEEGATIARIGSLIFGARI
jgi:pyridoxal phosphate enzyme (YggS family)